MIFSSTLKQSCDFLRYGNNKKKNNPHSSWINLKFHPELVSQESNGLQTTIICLKGSEAS